MCSRAGLMLLLAAAAMAVSGGRIAAAGADGEAPPATVPRGPAQRYSGESHCYAISFWLFRNAAVGRLTFNALKDGDCEAVFEARTAGMLRRIAGSRSAIIKSRMTFDAAAQRFRPLRYQEEFVHAEESRTRTVDYDYDRQTFTFTRANSGRVLGQTKKKLPAGHVEDILTAFYNLRSGLYGEVPFAGACLIPLLVTDRPSEVSLVFPPRSSHKPGHDYYAVAQIDPSISQVGARRIRGWLSAALVPAEAVIEDAYLFGNVTLRLAPAHEECTAKAPAEK